MFLYLSSFVEIVYYTTLSVAVLLLVTVVPILLIETYRDHVWTQYAENLDHSGFSGNSLKLLREVCGHHRLTMQDVFCMDEATGKLQPVTNIVNGNVFQFELFNSNQVMLGDIYGGYITIHSRIDWYAFDQIRRYFKLRLPQYGNLIQQTP